MEPTPIRWSLPAFVAVAVIFEDQASKALAERSGAPAFYGVRNAGVLTGARMGSAPFVIGAALLAFTVFAAVIGRWALRVGVSPAILALIGGGMLANLIDRVRYGAVRDFIHTPWLIFNLADIAVAAGLVALCVVAMWRMHQVRSEPQPSALRVGHV